LDYKAGCVHWPKDDWNIEQRLNVPSAIAFSVTAHLVALELLEDRTNDPPMFHKT
jgi:hypothetical protein